MKKKLLAIFLALCIAATLAPAAAAGDGAIAHIWYMTNEAGTNSAEMRGQGIDGTFSGAWSVYETKKDYTGTDRRNRGFLWGANVRFDCDEGETALIPAIEEGYSIDRKFSIYLDMGTEAAGLNIGGAFTVINGGSLKIQSSSRGIAGNAPKGALTVNISEPITVSGGGTLDLCFDPITVSRGVCDAYNFTGDAAIVANGGTVTIDSNLNITGEATPLQIDGAKVVLQNLYDYLNTTISGGSAPAISVQSGSLEINGADIYSNGAALEIGAGADVNMLDGNIETGDSIEIPSGARVRLSGGNISTEGSGPAVKVLSGASVTLGADISSGGDAAVTFDENASFTMAGRTFTVAEGENYLDNNGVAVLAAGANGGMNAALVLADGTVVEGSGTQAPSYEMVNGAPEVTVPAGGKVTDADGKVTELPNGGKVVGGEVEPTPTWTLTFKYGDGRPDEVRSVVRGASTVLPAPRRSGYAFLGWVSGGKTYLGGDTVTVTADTTFTASWVRHPDAEYVPEPEEPAEPETPAFPFYDVPASAWYYTAVKYVYDNGLMDGVDTYVFAPDDTLTRAMVWAILARMSGVDTTGGATWYAKAQEWVTAKGISDGENPTAAITREEFVTMLWRLAGEPLYTGDLSRVPDAGGISAWAQDAMLWAYVTGLVEGDETGAITPTANASRAAAAALVMRYAAM